MNNYNKFFETSLKNIRLSLSDFSIDNFVAITIESLMKIERDEYLEKTSALGGVDKGNGFYTRAFRSLMKNSLMINVPRTRNGVFNPGMLEILKIEKEKINELCLKLYQKGVTSRDIADIVQCLFSEKASPTTITNLTKKFNQFREAWQKSELEKHYKVIFCDCVFITVRRGDRYAKEAVYIATGVREDNKRELIALEINPTEGASIWGDIFTDLKNNRGVKRIDLVIADGIKNLENEIMKIYPMAEFQKCVVHKMRNVLKNIRPSDKEEIAKDLKSVFNNFEETATIENAKIKASNFVKKWEKRYSKIKNQFMEEDFEYYLTYIKFHIDVRRMIYTTNSIENLNRQVRKATKNKLSFETPESLLDYLFMVIKEFEEKNYIKYPVHKYANFKKNLICQTHFS